MSSGMICRQLQHVPCLWDADVLVAISHFTGRKGLFRYYILDNRIVVLIVFTLIHEIRGGLVT